MKILDPRALLVMGMFLSGLMDLGRALGGGLKQTKVGQQIVGVSVLS